MPRWKSRTTEERFWEKVDRNGPTIDGMDSCCWQWIGGKQTDGYGSFGDKDTSGKWRMVLAHRYSYELAFGKQSKTLEICHRCDNYACVRPDHLFLGTHTDNMRDMCLKGRSYDRRGEHNPKAKLSSGDVAEIRNLFSSGNYSKATLAKMFNVSKTNIKAIVENRIWREEIPHIFMKLEANHG